MQQPVYDQHHEPIDLAVLHRGDTDAAAGTALDLLRASVSHLERARTSARAREATDVLEHLHQLRGLFAMLGVERPHRSITAAGRAARIGSWNVAEAWLDEVARWLEHTERQLAVG